jgi:dipeptidyl aminopeptidase/acylaminoacyl peptidase
MANSSHSTEVLDGVETSGKKEAAYGGWTSPIDAPMVAGGALRLSQTAYDLDGQSLYFLEGRPTEGGRQVMVRRPAGSDPTVLEDVSAKGESVRSLAHEYGGGAYTVANGQIFYCNYSDQRVYMANVNLALSPAIQTRFALSPEGAYRFADFCLDGRNKRVLAVMEDHSRVKAGHGGEPTNSIVALSYAKAENTCASTPVTLAHGYDFYAFPRLSPDGTKLAYIRWNHPNLPWDDSELVVADVDKNGLLVGERVVAGGHDCSVFQPEWGPDGKLYFVCDSSGFWNLYAVCNFESLEVVPLVPKIFAQCEFGLPMWVFGQSTYVVASDNLIICAVNRRGLWHLARLELDFEVGHKLIEINSPYTDFSYLSLGSNKVAMLAGSADIVTSVVEYDWASRSFTTIKSSAPGVSQSGYLSKPEVIEFPTEGNKTAFAFYYPPTNKDFTCSGVPPLLVKCHGGPTGSASSVLSLGLQFWTSRGFAVVDVNYGGSTGYGREYRKRLNGNWGIVDVDDCVNAVKYLVKEGKADKERVAITGGSAGGYTVLCALTFKDVFSAGASHYGIGDLEALVRDTHKFEARYGDNLVGPYPQTKSVYMERSPINHIDKLKCPVIFFQGLDDKVVPPNQAEAMVEALSAKNIPVAYIAYEGEQHGFRQAANIIRTLEAELYFFRKIFKIYSAEQLKGVEIKNFADADCLSKSLSGKSLAD